MIGPINLQITIIIEIGNSKVMSEIEGIPICIIKMNKMDNNRDTSRVTETIHTHITKEIITILTKTTTKEGIAFRTLSKISKILEMTSLQAKITEIFRI